jgi:hypothetical protein
MQSETVADDHRERLEEPDLFGGETQGPATTTEPEPSEDPLSRTEADPTEDDRERTTPTRGRLRLRKGFDWPTFGVLALGTLALIWKMHAFKLPSEIALERAQKAGVPGPSSGIWRFLTDWLRPWAWGRGDLLKNSTATGGDMGAHVWTADVIKRVVLPQARLTGWTNEWFRGMKALGFYFPLPTLVIVVLSTILPYNVAFKMVTIAGIITLPAACWLSGKVAGLKRPVPTLMGIASFAFLFGRHYDLYIYGGNILSTMAGEFSFSISLSFAVLFLGLFVRVIKTGEKRGLAALCLAATGLSHLLPTMWVLLSAVLLLLTHLDMNELRPRNRRLLQTVLGAGAVFAGIVMALSNINLGIIAFGMVLFGLALYDHVTHSFGMRQLSDAILVLSCGGAIAGFWLLAFFEDLPYTNDMGWEKSTRYIEFLLPFWAKKPPADSHIIAVACVFALIGAASALWSLGSAMLRRAKQGKYWIPNAGSITVIISGLIGLAAGITQSSTAALLIGVAAGFVVSFLALITLAEESRWQQTVLLVVAVASAALVIAKWGSQITAIAAAAVLVITLLVLAAVNHLPYERWGLALTCIIAAAAAMFTQSPQFRLWNARVLPFWFFTILLLAAYGAARSVATLTSGLRFFATPHRGIPHAATWGILASAGVMFVAVGLPLNIVPGNVPVPKVKKGLIGVQLARQSTDSNPAPGWAAYNFKGYEGMSAWPEYRALMDEANRVAKTNGCGTAVYEYDDAKLSSFGTPLSPMLLPYWTKGCMGSMEGVYFESSATAPHHWLTAALITAPATNNADGSKKYSGPSNPQRDLPYQSFDLARGVQKMEEIGIKYYLAITDLAKQTADTLPSLRKVGSSGVFSFYQLVNAATVAPLAEEPVVVTGIDQDQYGGWLDVEMDRYNNPAKYPTTIAWSGPKAWQRTKARVKHEPNVRTFGTGVSVTPTQRKPLEPVLVSNIVEKEVDISFSVDRVGVPVVVRASYFPNWHVSGAKGPYRIMPNLMVVIPTSKNVKLHWGYSPADILGYPATLAGLAGAFLLQRRTRRRTYLADVAPEPLPGAIDMSDAPDMADYGRATADSACNDDPYDDDTGAVSPGDAPAVAVAVGVRVGVEPDANPDPHERPPA